MMTHTMGLNDREQAASVVDVSSVVPVGVPVAVGVALLVSGAVEVVVSVVLEVVVGVVVEVVVGVVVVFSSSHAEIPSRYLLNHARFASTVARAAVAAD